MIHNAPFDVAFLDVEFALAGHPALRGAVYAKLTDTLALAREMFPGKRNSLDALCERFGIDNAHRTLHGALLDAELLAEVWLAMTRGQESLTMDLGAAPRAEGGCPGGWRRRGGPRGAARRDRAHRRGARRRTANIWPPGQGDRGPLHLARADGRAEASPDAASSARGRLGRLS